MTAILRKMEGMWRKSYDVEDRRAQVSTIYWDVVPDNKNALRFFDTFERAIAQYSSMRREPGKPSPIGGNHLTVIRALRSFFDFKTGRCDPALDTIAKRCHPSLSRRTVIRCLDDLRQYCGIDWVRRTVRTGNSPGEGPQREQTSNSYFINLANMPIEILRTLRHKLGDRLREGARKVLAGSGPVPRLADKASTLINQLGRAFAGPMRTEGAERRALAAMTEDQRLAHMYRDDRASLEKHREMLASSVEGARVSDRHSIPAPGSKNKRNEGA